MCFLETFILNLQEFLISNNGTDHNIIRKHTKKLTELGDVSFPLRISNWHQFIGAKIVKEQGLSTVFDFKYLNIDQESVLDELIKKSLTWEIEVQNIIFKNEDAHIFFKHSSIIYHNVIKEVLKLNNFYGSSDIIKNKIEIRLTPDIEITNMQEIDLTILRLELLKDISKNVIDFSTSDLVLDVHIVYLVTNPIVSDCRNILCGPVINEKGVKSSYTAHQLYQKRSSDMRMMAQHKYGVQVKSNLPWENYFEKLGKASVTIEMLTNKPQKSIKINPNDLQSANKGASFIFYNCARLAALFKEFEKRILIKEYPELPSVDQIDFSLLNQSEEWELFYVYILQFPMVIKSCIKHIEKGILNPQHLISFLSNLSSVFSVYYRRIRILTNPKEHMVSLIHARIYLLKALQCVFHNALRLLNIEPVREM